jgi:hypothetical protein
MSAHTPGPWEPLTDRHCELLIFAPSAEEFVCGVTVFLPDAEANARLIAAAPDLLEALKRVCSHGYRTSPDWDNARAAIAKAEGPYE